MSNLLTLNSLFRLFYWTLVTVSRRPPGVDHLHPHPPVPSKETLPLLIFLWTPMHLSVFFSTLPCKVRFPDRPRFRGSTPKRTVQIPTPSVYYNIPKSSVPTPHRLWYDISMGPRHPSTRDDVRLPTTTDLKRNFPGRPTTHLTSSSYL